MQSDTSSNEIEQINPDGHPAVSITARVNDPIAIKEAVELDDDGTVSFKIDRDHAGETVDIAACLSVETTNAVVDDAE